MVRLRSELEEEKKSSAHIKSEVDRLRGRMSENDGVLGVAQSEQDAARKRASKFETASVRERHRLTEFSFFVGKKVANKIHSPSFPFLQGSLSSFVFFLIVTIKGPF